MDERVRDPELCNSISRLISLVHNRLDLWTHLIEANGCKTAAEIGVWKGEFSALLLKSCPSITTYYLIDPWRHLDDWNKPANVSPQEFETIYSEAMARTDFAAARRTVLRGTTLEVANEIPNGALDFAYIDGDHTLKGISTDLIAILPKMRAGGVIGGDDFCPGIWQHGVEYEPTLVFPFAVHFALAIRATIYALPFNQFLISLPVKAHAGSGDFVDLVGSYGTLTIGDQLMSLRQKAARYLRRFISQ